MAERGNPREFPQAILLSCLRRLAEPGTRVHRAKLVESWSNELMYEAGAATGLQSNHRDERAG